jgi:hypothetical protein
VTIPFKSASFECVANGDGSVTLNVKAYVASSTCSGVMPAIPYTLDAGCQSGAIYACGSTSQAVANNWPAIAVYEGDSTCTSGPTAVAGFVPNVCNAGISSDGTKQGSAIVTMTDTTLNANAYGSMDCTGDASHSLSAEVNVCSQMTPPPQLMYLVNALKESLSKGKVMLGQTFHQDHIASLLTSHLQVLIISLPFR